MTTATAALPPPAHAHARRKRRSQHGPEYRGWQAFWALPAITALLLTVHLGGVVERVYLPIAVLLAVYLCLKFPRVYVAYTLLAITVSPMVNRIAASQSVLLTKSPVLAAPLLVVAVSALRMWRARPPGYRALIFTMPMLGILYGIGVGIVTIGMGSVLLPAAGWLCPIFFGLFCYAHEDDRHSLADMYLRSVTVAGLVIAIYGLWQYAAPAQWDLDWLQQMQDQGAAVSMGKPEVYGIRIFSTVSSPASAAVFLASAFLAISSLRSRWRIPGMACTLVTLSLTSVRAAWLALAIASVLLLLRASTKARLQAVAGLVALVFVAIALGQTPHGSGIVDRFSSFGDLKNDHSLRDRRADMDKAMTMIRSKPFGGGLGYVLVAGDVRFSPVDVGAVAIPIDLGYLGTLLYAAGLLLGVSTTQFPVIREGGRSLGLAVMSLLPLLLLADENLLGTYSGLLFFAPAALLIRSRLTVPGEGAEQRSFKQRGRSLPPSAARPAAAGAFLAGRTQSSAVS